MSKTWDAIIVGGGVAGCASAIEMAQRGWDVLLLEQKRYPANKLCGEFLSIEAASYFERLGVLNQIRQSGARLITRYQIASVTGARIPGDLPGTALGYSREKLDSLLMEHARAIGAACRDGCSVTQITGSLVDGFTVTTPSESHRARCVIGAYGKRSKLDASITRPMDKETGFCAFKMHYSGIHAPETIELFSFSGGYVGISPVEDELVNACYIVRRKEFGRNGGVEEFIRASALQNQALANRLDGLTPVGKMTGISEIPFQTKGTFHNDICMVGDSAGMIAPLCGDGMSMAMRAAQIASAAAAAFLAAEIDGPGFRRAYSVRWNREFRMRLAVGRALQQISVYPSAADLMVRMCGIAPILTHSLIGATRGKAIPQVG